MKQITIYLPDWLYAKIKKIMKEIYSENLSDTIRTVLIFAARDFEKYLRDIDQYPEKKTDNETTAQLFVQLLHRLDKGGVLQNAVFPAFPAGFEPATHCVPTVDTVVEQIFFDFCNSLEYRDHTCDLLREGEL